MEKLLSLQAKCSNEYGKGESKITWADYHWTNILRSALPTSRRRVKIWMKLSWVAFTVSSTESLITCRESWTNCSARQQRMAPVLKTIMVGADTLQFLVATQVIASVVIINCSHNDVNYVCFTSSFQEVAAATFLCSTHLQCRWFVAAYRIGIWALSVFGYEQTDTAASHLLVAALEYQTQGTCRGSLSFPLLSECSSRPFVCQKSQHNRSVAHPSVAEPFHTI